MRRHQILATPLLTSHVRIAEFLYQQLLELSVNDVKHWTELR